MEATMSMFDSDDMPGYSLPDDSQSQLKKLRDCALHLSRLVRQRGSEELRGDTPGVRMDELAICLELLSEQMAVVLDEVSQQAQRQTEATKSAVAPAASPQLYGSATERFAVGITLEQIDALNRLSRTISAHGDVVACSRAAELASDTLPQVGQAIYDGMEAVRALLQEVEAQQLRHRRDPRNGMAEERAVYEVGLATAVCAPGCRLPAPMHALDRRAECTLTDPLRGWGRRRGRAQLDPSYLAVAFQAEQQLLFD
jgi:hypothetical protein